MSLIRSMIKVHYIVQVHFLLRPKRYNFFGQSKILEHYFTQEKYGSSYQKKKKEKYGSWTKFISKNMDLPIKKRKKKSMDLGPNSFLTHKGPNSFLSLMLFQIGLMTHKFFYFKE